MEDVAFNFVYFLSDRERRKEEEAINENWGWGNNIICRLVHQAPDECECMCVCMCVCVCVTEREREREREKGEKCASEREKEKEPNDDEYQWMGQC